MEVRNTPPKPRIADRADAELLEDYCLAVRKAAVSARWSRDGAGIDDIGDIQSLHAELARRSLSAAAGIEDLSAQTKWQLDIFADACIAYPNATPELRDQAGVREYFRCNLCSKVEFPETSEWRMCTSCLQETLDTLDRLTPLPGLLYYRTYNASKRCSHADSETVLVTWDDEEFWETGKCKVCLTDELAQRGG